MPSTRRRFLAALAAGTATTAVARTARGERARPPASDAGARTPSSSATAESATRVWARRYGTAGDTNDEGLDVVPAHEDGVVFLWRGADGWYLQHLAPDGRPGWSRGLRSGIFRGSLARVRTGYVVVGEDTNRHSTAIVRTDERGRTRGSDSLRIGPEETAATALVRTTDGGVAMVGYPGVDGSRAFVAKLDADGAVAWKRVVDPPKTRLHDVGPAPDGGAYAVGSLDRREGAGHDAVAVRLSAGGEVRWQRSYGGAYRDGYYAVTPTRNGFLAGGMRARGDDDRPRALVLHDAAGTPVWRRSDRDDPFVDALAFEDGYLAVSDSRSPSAVVRTDRWGRPQWSSAVSPAPGPLVRDADAVAPVDGGYVFAATRPHTQETGAEALAVKLAPPPDG